MTEAGVAATFGYRHEAEFARETLKEAGIDSILAGDDAGGTHPSISFVQPFKLLVRPEDLDRARALLGGTESEPDPGPAA